MRVLISDKLSENGLEILKKAKGIEVDNQPDLGKDPAKLKEALKTAHALIIRSASKVTADIIASSENLKVIGRAGIGVDNVDVPAASKKGIIVMNTPGGNAVTTAEHAISMMCALTREIPQATASIKSGKWEKNRFMGKELFRKTLGLIGCGNIGKIVADRALGLRMKVITFDPFLTDEMAKTIGVVKVELDQLFKESDYITLHVPKTEKTANLLCKETFAKMKKGVFIINCARGGIINEADLAQAIEQKIVAGAALDVFEKEPVDPANPLLKLDQVICTPHLGASTDEAQENVALDVANQIVDYLTTGTIQNAINVPAVSAEMLPKIEPSIQLARKIGKFSGALIEEAPESINIEYAGDIATLPVASVTIGAIGGVLESFLEDVSVNTVNAPFIAKERGIKITESKTTAHEDYSSLITLTLGYKSHKTVVSGTIFGKKNARIVRINDYYLEATPEGQILIIQNEDKPGVVGAVGTLLAKNNINISSMQLGLAKNSKQALALYNVEGKIADAVLSELKKLPGITSVQLVSL